MSLSLDGTGNLAYELTGSSDAESDGGFHLANSQAPLDPPVTFHISEIGSITVNAGRGSDRLKLDFINGSPVPVDGIDFHGWEDVGDTDALELIGYDAAIIDVVHQGIESGMLRIDDGPVISYSQTDSLVLGGTVADLVIDLSQTGLPDLDVTVGDVSPAGFSAMNGSTVEFTQFANPTRSLTFDFEAVGVSGADTIRIEGFDRAFDADLNIRGGRDDTVEFQTNPTDLGPTSRNLIVTASAVNIHQSLSVSGSAVLSAHDDISFDAAGNLSANGAGVLITAGGDVVLDGNVRSGSGHLSVVAGDDILQNADLSTTAGTMFVSASDETSDENSGIVMQPGAAITSAGGNIRLEAAGEGDILLGLVDAGAGSVSLVAERDILDNNGGGWLNIHAAELRMQADSDVDRIGQIGQSDVGSPPHTNANAIDTRVMTLAAISADGIHVLESDGLRVDAIPAISVRRVSSDLSITTVTDSSLSDLETTDAGSIVVLSTTGPITVDDGDTDGMGILAGTKGNVLLEARADPALVLEPSPLPTFVDGSFFIIERQFGGMVLERAVFEFDVGDGGSVPGSFLVPFNTASTTAEIAQAIVDQIQIADIGLFPRNLGSGRVHLGSQSELFVDLQTPNLMLMTDAGGMADGDVVLTADVRSSSGQISVAAGDDVIQNADIITGDTGTVSVTAGAGSITMADMTITASVHGPIIYSATGDVGLSVLTTADGNIHVTADSDADDAGSITDATAAEDANLVTRAMVTLIASSGIGFVGDTDIDTMIGLLEATNRGNGDVVIQETDGLVVSGTGVQTAGDSGRIRLEVDTGELTISSIVASSAAGEVTLVAADGPIALESAARVHTAGGELNLESGLAISMAKGSVVDAGGGDVSLVAQYGVLLGRVVSPGATVTIDAGQGGIADGVDPADLPDADGADIEADTATLRAAGSIGTRLENTPLGVVVVRLDTKINRLNALSKNGVGIFLVNEGPLVIEQAEAGRTEPPLGIVDITTSSDVGGSLHEGEANVDSSDRFDVNNDGVTTSLDALLVINALHERGTQQIDRFFAESARFDVDGDAFVSPIDVLQIINYLNLRALQNRRALSNDLAPATIERKSAAVDSRIGPFTSEPAIGFALCLFDGKPAATGKDARRPPASILPC